MSDAASTQDWPKILKISESTEFTQMNMEPIAAVTQSLEVAGCLPSDDPVRLDLLHCCGKLLMCSMQYVAVITEPNPHGSTFDPKYKDRPWNPANQPNEFYHGSNLTPRLKLAIDIAQEAAKDYGLSYVGMECLLIAMTRIKNGTHSSFISGLTEQAVADGIGLTKKEAK